MFKHTVKYTDYNGESREKDVYFNISMPEMLKIQHSIPGGYGQFLEKISKEQDPMVIWSTFEDLIDYAYGEKSLDGERFVKKAEDGHKLVEDFKETPVFEAFMFELLSNDQLASDMVNKMIPTEMLNKMVNGGGVSALATA